jgi:hypothetical protein
MVVPVLLVKSKSSLLAAVAVTGLKADETTTSPQAIIEPRIIALIADFLNASYTFIGFIYLIVEGLVIGLC